MKDFLKSKTAMWLGGGLLLLLVLYFVFRDNVDSAAMTLMGAEFETDPDKMDMDKVLSKSKSSRGSEVAELQRRLKQEGHDLGTYGPNKDGIDGVFGTLTEKALMAARGVSSTSLNAFSASLPGTPPPTKEGTTKEFVG